MPELSDITHKHYLDSSEWLGKLSATVGIAAEDIAQGEPKVARSQLRSTLAAFIASPVPSEELREMLRGYLR